MLSIGPIAEALFRISVYILCLLVVAVAIVMLRRTWRGEEALTTQDWRLLFGKPKADVLTARYVGKVLVAFVGCALVGGLASLILMTLGAAWYAVGMVVAAVLVVVLAPRVLH